MAKLPNVCWTEFDPRASPYLAWARVSCWLNLQGHRCVQDRRFSYPLKSNAEACGECHRSCNTLPSHQTWTLPVSHQTSQPSCPLLHQTEPWKHTHAWKDRQTDVTFFLSDCSDCCPTSDGNPLKSSTWSLLIIMKFLHSGPTFVWYPSLKHTVFTGPIKLWNESVISQLAASCFLSVCSSGFSSVLQTRHCAPTLHNASGALFASLPGSNHNH